MEIQRWLGPALLGALAVFTFGSCGGQKKAAGDQGPVNITFYTYNYMNQQKAGVDQLLREFHEANPDITVEMVFAPSTELNSKIQADIAAGVVPDVIQIVFDALDYSVRNFGIQDLNNIAPAEDLRDHLAGFSPAALGVAKLDGRLYGLPYTFSTPMLFYNTAIFREAGLDPDKPPRTWEELRNAARQIAERTGKNSFVLGGTTANDWLLQALILSNGGSVLSPDRKTITFGEAPALEVMEMLQSMRREGAHASMNDVQGWEAFFAGNLGMILTTAAMQSSMLGASKAAGWELRTARMPSFGDKPAVPVNSGSGLFVCSRDPKKQAAAWRFIKFVTSDRGYTIITTMMGYPPLRPNVTADERYLKTWAEENPLVQPNLEQIEIVTPWQSYPGSNWQQIERILMDAMNKCLFTDANVRETLQAAQKQAQSLMPK
jgi:multiple sugar transport system substrate-binding protein